MRVLSLFFKNSAQAQQCTPVCMYNVHVHVHIHVPYIFEQSLQNQTKAVCHGISPNVFTTCICDHTHLFEFARVATIYYAKLQVWLGMASIRVYIRYIYMHIYIHSHNLHTHTHTHVYVWRGETILLDSCTCTCTLMSREAGRGKEGREWSLAITADAPGASAVM